MRIVLLGAPGSGKGTQAGKLSAYYGIPLISSVSVLKEATAAETDAGIQARIYQDHNQHVPDEILLLALRDRLLKPDIHNGFLLVGFPRTTAQADALDGLLEELNLPLDLVLRLEGDPDHFMERLEGRRICQSCGAMYNVFTAPPIVEEVCDLCGGRVKRRADDNEETIASRMRIYESQSASLIRYYALHGKLRQTDGGAGDEAVFRALRQILDEHPPTVIETEPVAEPPVPIGLPQPGALSPKPQPEGTGGKEEAKSDGEAGKTAAKRAAVKEPATKKTAAEKEVASRKSAANEAAKKKAPSGRLPAKKAGGKGVSNRPAAKKAAGKAVAKKPAVKKAAGKVVAKKPAVKKVATKKAPPKKAAPGKAAPKRATARKVLAKRGPAGKPAAGKGTAKTPAAKKAPAGKAAQRRVAPGRAAARPAAPQTQKKRAQPNAGTPKTAKRTTAKAVRSAGRAAVKKALSGERPVRKAAARRTVQKAAVKGAARKGVPAKRSPPRKGG